MKFGQRNAVALGERFLLTLPAKRDGGVADDFGNFAIEIHHQSGVFVDADDELVLVEVLLENLQSALTEIAKSRVVVPALGVVVVGNHRCVNAKLTEHIQTLEPIWIDSRLVDLVNGHGSSAECECSCGGKGDQSARGEFANQHRAQRRVAPLAQRVRRGSRAGKDVVRIVDHSQTLFDSDCVDCIADGIGLHSGEACNPQIHIDAGGEVVDCALRKFWRILLESVRRVEYHCANGSRNQRGESAMRGHHRRGGFTRAHDGENSWHGHAKNPSSMYLCSVIAHLSGNWACTSWCAGENHSTRT